MYYFCTKNIFIAHRFVLRGWLWVRQARHHRQVKVGKETKKVNEKQVFLTFFLCLLSSPPAGFATGRMPIFWRGMHGISGDFYVTLFTGCALCECACCGSYNTFHLQKYNQSDQGLQHPPPLNPVGKLDPGEDGHAGGLPGHPVWELWHYSIWNISGRTVGFLNVVHATSIFFAHSWTTTPTPLTRPATPASWLNPSTESARRCSS